MKRFVIAAMVVVALALVAGTAMADPGVIRPMCSGTDIFPCF